MIYHIIEPSCYQRLTNGLAIPRIAQQLGIECKSYMLYEWQNEDIEKDSSSDAVFITESAFHRIKPLKALRKKIPNGKIVNLGSDSIYYTFYNKDEIEVYPELVDLWLDTMIQSVGHYSIMGIPSDLWKWTISEAYIEQIQALPELKAEKVYDAVCLAQLNSPYRKDLSKTLLKQGYNIVWGDGTRSSELIDLQKLYASSYLCLGTTSSAGKDPIRSMKGWRDWIAPFFGSLLIYDDHPEMDWALPVVKYKYDDLEDLTDLLHLVKDLSPMQYDYCVMAQKDFIIQYTLEKQFKTLLTKHNIV